MIVEVEMDDKKKIARFDIYCDCCNELIIKGAEYYETEAGRRLCPACEEV